MAYENMAAMMSMGPKVFGGIALFNLLMAVAGVFYLVCALFIWQRVREEKNELLSALFAFLVYQAVNMFFIAIWFQTGNHIAAYISGLSIMIGAAYMLKFPFHSFAEATRKTLFILTLIVAFGIFGWFVIHPDLFSLWTNFTLGLDIAINGILVGGSIIAFAFLSSEKWQRYKAAGGGSGVLACCIVGNATLLSGSLIISSVFQFLAPVLILGTLAYTKHKVE